MARRTHKSDLMAVIHENAQALFNIGAIDKKTRQTVIGARRAISKVWELWQAGPSLPKRPASLRQRLYLVLRQA
jgi:hypothetical protein